MHTSMSQLDGRVVGVGKWEEEKWKDRTRGRFSQHKREKSLFEGGWRGVEKEGEERLASLKSPNPLTSVAGAKMEDHTAF